MTLTLQVRSSHVTVFVVIILIIESNDTSFATINLSFFQEHCFREQTPKEDTTKHKNPTHPQAPKGISKGGIQNRFQSLETFPSDKPEKRTKKKEKKLMFLKKENIIFFLLSSNNNNCSKKIK